MAADAKKLATLLRDKASAITEAFLAPRPEGPVRPDSPPEVREFWRAAGLQSVESIARWIEGTRPNDIEIVRPYVEASKKIGVGLADIVAGRSALSQELAACLLREGPGLSSEETIAVMSAGHDVLNRGMDAYLHYAESFFQSEQTRLLASLEALGVVVFRADPETRILAANRAGAEVLGARSPKELIGRRFAEFYADEGARRSLETQLQEKGELQHFRFRLRRLDGQVRWCETNIRMVLGPEGELLGFEGFARDISALADAEDARRRSEELYRDLVDNLIDVIYETDTNGVLTYISAVAESLTGYLPREIIGRPFATFIHPDDLDRVRELFAAGLAGRFVPGNFRVVTKSGGLRWVRSSDRPVVIGGRTVGLRGVLSDVTAQVEAEGQRERLERILHEVPICVLEVNPEGKFSTVSSGAVRLLGASSPEDLVGQPAESIWADPADRRKMTQELVANGQVAGWRARGRRLDGSTFWFSAFIRLLRDAEGRVLGNEGFLHDITGLVEAEAEQRRTADLLGGIVASAGEYAIVSTDGEGRVNYFSEGAERLFGLKASAAVEHLRLEDLWAPDGRPAFSAALAALASGGDYEDDAELLRTQGLTFAGRVSGSARRGPGGELSGYTFVIRDVTEERAAQKLVTLLAHATESSREGVVLTDMSGVITYLNPAMTALFGREPGELLGKDMSILYARDTPGDDIRAIARATLAGGWSGEITSVRKDGSSFPAYLTTSLVRDEHGRAVAMVGLTRDVSREKSLQRRLYEQEQRHLAELERQVQERTAELERAYRDLQKLDSMKDRFLANVSHELRTPLVSGVGYIELILHEGLGPINDEIRRGLQVAHRNLLRLVNLIDDLLAFTRLGSGREAMTISRFDLAQMVNDCLLDLKVRAGKRSLHLQADIEKGLPAVEADEENIHRVLTNLLSNAEKFTGDDAAIVVSARRLSDSRIEVRVTDNGVGIPPDEIEQVFDRFYRSRRTSSPRYGGTGIGLSLVKEILEAHGCSIQAQSPGEHGTTIVFTLPAAGGPADPARPSAARPAGAGHRGTATILVVDDDPDVHDLLGSVFHDSGDRLLRATNGEEALALAAQDELDLIFLDFCMEGLDGFEVFRRLRANEQTRHVPVYVVTARADSRAAFDSLPSKPDGFLTKPFSIAEVKQVVSEVLGGTPEEPPEQAKPPAT